MKRLVQILKETEQQNRAFCHFNFSCLEQIRGIFEAVKSANFHVIAAVSEKERKFLGVGLAKNLVDYFNFSLRQKLIFLSADHCCSLESIKEAIKANYDLIVVDFSKFPLKQNIEKTKKAVKLIRTVNSKILIEGELGHLPGQSNILARAQKTSLTKLEEAEIFVKETKIDLLAPSVGNFHGKVLNFFPKIDIDLIKKIKQKIKIPLVLHGGSGIKHSVLKKAVRAGISIVHFNTDIREVWKKSLEKSMKENKKEIAPYKILPAVIDNIKKEIKSKSLEVRLPK